MPATNSSYYFIIMLAVKWIDEGAHFGKTDNIARCFIIDKGELKEGQKVRVQLSKKKGSRAKVWNGEIVAPPNVDKRAREPMKKKKESVKEKGSKNPPAHIKKSPDSAQGR